MPCIQKNYGEREDNIFAVNVITLSNGIGLYTEHIGVQDTPAILLIAGAMCPARYWTNGFCQQLSDAGAAGAS